MTDKKAREAPATRPMPFPKGDARRLFVLLAAIDQLDRPTLWNLPAFIGHNKGTIDADVLKLVEQYGVQIEKEDAVYKIVSWGSILNREGILQFMPV